MSMMKGCSFAPEEIEDLKEAFILFDEEGRGEISTRDLQNCVAMLGFDEVEGVFELLMKSPDVNINFDEFCSIIREQVLGANDEELIEKLFKSFDFDGSQKINIDDLENAAKSIGATFSRAELEDMIQVADHNNDDQIDLNEFSEMVHKTLHHC